jgi:hypothetical protein
LVAPDARARFGEQLVTSGLAACWRSPCCMASSIVVEQTVGEYTKEEGTTAELAALRR